MRQLTLINVKGIHGHGYEIEPGELFSMLAFGDDIQVSDGYHTMSELYEHRMALNAFLFKMMYLLDEQTRGKTLATHTPLVLKAKFHNDGTMFPGGYFIVIAHTSAGDISYHYKLEHWDKFQIPEKERVPWAYDGHTPQDTIERLLKL
jgi:hypothetical protein